MKNFIQLTLLSLFLCFGGCTCPNDRDVYLTVVNGQINSCTNQQSNKSVFVLGNDILNDFGIIDTIFTDNSGFFQHNFTSTTSVVYYLPGDQDCSSAWASPARGQISEVTLNQSSIFDALDLEIDISIEEADSIRLIINRISDQDANGSLIIFPDVLNFDSGYTSNWDTLSRIYRLGKNCNYLVNVEIQPDGSDRIILGDTIQVKEMLVSKSFGL